MPKRNAFRFGQSKAEAPPLWHFPSPVLAIRSIASFDSLTRFERATPIATRIYPSAAWQTCCAFTRQQRPPSRTALPQLQTFTLSTLQLFNCLYVPVWCHLYSRSCSLRCSSGGKESKHLHQRRYATRLQREKAMATKTIAPTIIKAIFI